MGQSSWLYKDDSAEVPVGYAEYAFNQFYKFCKDDVSPMVADIQKSPVPLHEGVSFIKQILTNDLTVVHDHENILSVQRVNEDLEIFARRTKTANATLLKRKVKPEAAKAILEVHPETGEFSLLTARNYRLIKPGHPPACVKNLYLSYTL